MIYTLASLSKIIQEVLATNLPGKLQREWLEMALYTFRQSAPFSFNSSHIPSFPNGTHLVYSLQSAEMVFEQPYFREIVGILDVFIAKPYIGLLAILTFRVLLQTKNGLLKEKKNFSDREKVSNKFLGG